MKIKIVATTDTGKERTNNEDAYIICPDLSQQDWSQNETPTYIPLNKYGSILVVADGMGGANAGEVASAIATKTIRNHFSKDNLEKLFSEKDADIPGFLNACIKEADGAINQRIETDPDTAGMGTTIVVCWIFDQVAHIAWCGDSRCYVYNDNRGLIQLTRDHSYVQELVDMGQLNPENMHTHPYANIITHCLGDSGNAAQPECHVYNMNDGDIILLCSDGLTTMCRDPEIEQIIKEHDPATCCDSLISSALEKGGYDNVTIAMCEYRTEQ